MKNKGTICLLAAGHGLNDLIAGYFLGSLVAMKFDMVQTSLGLFIYNLLAFGGQYPAALWIEKYSNPKNFLTASYVLNVVAIALFNWIPNLSIVVAGIASAIYHVAGGAVCARDNKAVNIGLFAAPGVMGLITGGYFAFIHLSIINWLLLAGILFLCLLFWYGLRINLFKKK